jgi:hypothetical protein
MKANRWQIRASEYAAQECINTPVMCRTWGAVEESPEDEYASLVHEIQDLKEVSADIAARQQELASLKQQVCLCLVITTGIKHHNCKHFEAHATVDGGRSCALGQDIVLQCHRCTCCLSAPRRPGLSARLDLPKKSQQAADWYPKVCTPAERCTEYKGKRPLKQRASVQSALAKSKLKEFFGHVADKAVAPAGTADGATGSGAATGQGSLSGGATDAVTDLGVIGSREVWPRDLLLSCFVPSTHRRLATPCCLRQQAGLWLQTNT